MMVEIDGKKYIKFQMFYKCNLPERHRRLKKQRTHLKACDMDSFNECYQYVKKQRKLSGGDFKFIFWSMEEDTFVVGSR